MIATRWLVYGAALAGAAALTFVGDRPFGSAASEIVDASPRKPGAWTSGVARLEANSGSGEAPSGHDGRWVALRPRESLWRSDQARAPARDLFPAQSWVQPQRPLAAGPVAPPRAPPLPFTFLGKRHDGQQWDVFLARGDYTFIVQEGSTIENTYRIESVKPPTLTMTYLPSAQAQTLSIGGAD